MSQKSNCPIAVIGIDIGKNSFYVVGHDRRGAIVLRQKWSRGQVEARLANLPACLIGMENGRLDMKSAAQCSSAGAEKEGDQTLPHSPLNKLKAALHLCKGGRVIVEGFG